jgi:hypothetical protein
VAVTPAPGRWHTREDSGLKLDRALGWWHDGERIEHPNIVEAFNQGVRVLPDGRVTLHFGGDWCFVEVEGCAYGVLAVDEAPGDRLAARLTDRTAELLDLATLQLDEDGAFTVQVKQGLARARFTRAAHADFAHRLEAGEDGQLVVRVGATRWPTSFTA